MQRYGIIYKITNKINGKSYIGRRNDQNRKQHKGYKFEYILEDEKKKLDKKSKK